MAMQINPIAATITTTATQTVQASLLYLDRLNVDASNRPSGATQPPVKATATVTPYAVNGSTPQFADSKTLNTADLYAACAALPAVAAAMTAVQAGMVAWANYATAAQAQLDANATKTAALSIAVGTAKAALANSPTDATLQAAVTAAIATHQASLNDRNRLVSVRDPAIIGSAMLAVAEAQAALTASPEATPGPLTQAVASATAALTALQAPA